MAGVVTAATRRFSPPSRSTWPSFPGDKQRHHLEHSSPHTQAGAGTVPCREKQPTTVTAVGCGLNVASPGCRTERHFGTDLLLSSWLWMIGCVAYAAYAATELADVIVEAGRIPRTDNI